MYHHFISWRDGMLARRLYARSRSPGRLAEVPPALLPYWQATAGIEFPGLPRGAASYARSLDGLLSFFDCVRVARAPCALPSRAADSVWHAWLAFDATGLERFCLRHFGQPIPHQPAEAMAGDPDRTLAACMVAARVLQDQAPAGPALPLLFKLDETLRMPLGFFYSVDRGRIGCGRLDERGKARGPRRYPEQLTPAGLWRAGLVTEADYLQAMRALALGDLGDGLGRAFADGFGSDTSAGSGADDSCDAAGDSGGDSCADAASPGPGCGSSCGSSCGGGCGGGD